MTSGLQDLNPEQRAALEADGDVLIIACPGSGKTRTLTHKIASELSQVSSHREFVVALTYTHVAAEEIRDRIEAMGIDTTQLWVGTIHSFCLTWILRPYSLYHEALKDGFSVIDTFESEELLDEIAKRNPPLKGQFDCKYYATELGFSLDKSTPEENIDPLRSTIAEYHERLLEQKQIDFEMMLKFAHDLITNHLPIAKRLGQLFRIVAIDEYQDTRDIQYSIVSKIIREPSSKSRLFVVGDPNQAIFGSLGGVAKTAGELAALTGRPVNELALRSNYRSSQQIVQYFSNFAVAPMEIEAAGEWRDWSGHLVHDISLDKTELVQGVAELIRHNVEVLGVPSEQICIVAPWWLHLASITRSLVQALPEYEFNGPGLSPFGQNLDNFWYKVARIALTHSAPDMFRRRIRWAREVIEELATAGNVRDDLSARDFLKATNGIEVPGTSGTRFLTEYFDAFCAAFGFVPRVDSELAFQRESFFDRMQSRLARIQKDEGVDVDDLETFRKVFRPRNGIVVSTIHGIKGAEFDSVIAFGLLEGIVPHFGEPASEKTDVANKLMFVIGSRARKHLYLISETGRGNQWYPKYQTSVLKGLATYPYTSRLITRL